VILIIFIFNFDQVLPDQVFDEPQIPMIYRK